MHISEGILPLSWAGFWWAGTGAILALSFKKIKKELSLQKEKKSLLAFMVALVFLFFLYSYSCSLCRDLFSSSRSGHLSFCAWAFRKHSCRFYRASPSGPLSCSWWAFNSGS